MRNVYHHLNLRLLSLTGLYIGLFGLYISLPADFTELRRALSLAMLLVLIITTILALGTLKPASKRHNRHQLS